MGHFLQLSKGKLTDNKNIVISKDVEGRISIAQQLEVDNEGQIQNIFLKNAIITDKQGLSVLLAVIQEAIEKI